MYTSIFMEDIEYAFLVVYSEFVKGWMIDAEPKGEDHFQPTFHEKSHKKKPNLMKS